MKCNEYKLFSIQKTHNLPPPLPSHPYIIVLFHLFYIESLFFLLGIVSQVTKLDERTIKTCAWQRWHTHQTQVTVGSGLPHNMDNIHSSWLQRIPVTRSHVLWYISRRPHKRAQPFNKSMTGTSRHVRSCSDRGNAWAMHLQPVWAHWVILLHRVMPPHPHPYHAFCWYWVLTALSRPTLKGRVIHLATHAWHSSPNS